MRIDTITLTNYRCHSGLEVDFSPSFNVLVGGNGSGKTSLLNGICEVLAVSAAEFSPVQLQMLGDDAVRRARVDVQGQLRFEPQFPVSVNARGMFNGARATWGVERNALADRPHVLPQPAAAISQNSGTESGQTLPLLAYYRASRRWDQGDQHEPTAATQRTSRMDAYKNYWDASTNAGALLVWAMSKSLERFQVSSETGQAFDDIHNDELALVNHALANAIDEIKGIKYDMREKGLLVEWKHDSPSGQPATLFANLSDGQRAVVGLVADIARRICILNPHLGLEVLKQTPGVVLVDELDTHLHPTWQRALTLGLQSAFPAIQFIVASHSPQVLSEMKPEQIIVLIDGMSANPQVSYGLDSSAVLEEIMGASARPLEVADELSLLFAALARDELDVARERLAALRTKAPGIVELNRAEALLKRKEILGR